MGCCFSNLLNNTNNGPSNSSESGNDNPTFTNLGKKDVDEESNHIRCDHDERYRNPPTRSQRDKKKTIVEAVWDYGDDTATQGEMPFKKGERMEIIKDDDDWWLAKKVDTGEEGYIPSNFVQIVDYDNPLIYPWYHGKVSRKVAETRLKDDTNDVGTFLIRQSDDPDCSHALSVLTDDKEKNRKRVVKHYRIRYADGAYFITNSRSFETLLEFVTSYLGDSHGLCCELTVACPKERPPIYDLCKSTTIPKEDLTFERKLAEGNFGEVWKGKYKDKMDVAIKKLKEGSMPVEKFLEEAVVMKKLRHERILAILAVCTDSGTHYIITELLRESLITFLKSAPEQNICNLLLIASQIAEGMAYMESMKYVHRDLAARNILMVDDCQVKIGDFGLSRLVLEDEDGLYIPSKDFKVPIKWTAPEALSESEFSSKSDVWAFGIVLTELTNRGEQPYKCVGNNGVKNHQLVHWLSVGNRHPRPSACPEDLYRLMLRCWNKEPQSRPSFSEIVVDLEEIIGYATSKEDDFEGYKDEIRKPQ